MKLLEVCRSKYGSHPTRVRGLKPELLDLLRNNPAVAPHAGAWIETGKVPLFFSGSLRRTPRGCVD